MFMFSKLSTKHFRESKLIHLHKCEMNFTDVGFQGAFFSGKKNRGHFVLLKRNDYVRERNSAIVILQINKNKSKFCNDFYFVFSLSEVFIYFHI